MDVDASGNRGEEPGEPDPPGAAGLFPDKIKHSVPVIRRLHVNLGHPSFPMMSRILRDAGADPSVIEALKNLDCTLCAVRKRPRPARPASVPTYY